MGAAANWPAPLSLETLGFAPGFQIKKIFIDVVLLVDLNITDVDRVVSRLFEIDAVTDAPGQGLLVQRKVAEVLFGDAMGFMQHLGPLFLVSFGGDFAGQFLDLGVGVATAVPGASILAF